MTEKTLLLKTACLFPYFISATDFPSARVFQIDGRQSKIVTVLELPNRYRNALASVRLTSVALGYRETGHIETETGRQKTQKGRVKDVDVSGSYLAAMGLSNGTLLLQDIHDESSATYTVVSETQKALISLFFFQQFLFVLSENATVYVFHFASVSEGPLFSFKVQAGATSVCVQESGDASYCHVLVAGPTSVVYGLDMAEYSQKRSTQTRKEVLVDKMATFASQGARVDYCWISTECQSPSNPEQRQIAVVTASAQEGLIRVWEVTVGNRHQVSRLGHIAQCQRTLLCGQRISNLSVHAPFSSCPATTTVLASTFTGFVLVWELDRGLLPAGATQPLPLAPNYAFYSADPQYKLLYSALVNPTEGDSIPILFVRGKYAVPHFEVSTIENSKKAFELQLKGEAISPEERSAAAGRRKRVVDSLGFGGASTVEVVELPSTHPKEKDTLSSLPHDIASQHFDVVDEVLVWLQQQHLAHRSLNTPTESFKKLHLYHAASVKDLPVQKLTLEERLRALQQAAEAENRRNGTDAGEAEEVEGAHSSHTLGLSTVPLYQALHAGDESAVMELLSLASRNAKDKRSTVERLDINYVLLLLHMLCQRIGIIGKSIHKAAPKPDQEKKEESSAITGGGLADISARSPLIEWFQYILHYRGMQLVQLQRSIDEGETVPESLSDLSAEPKALTPSPPKDYVAPLYHQYKQMVDMQDKLSLLHGRLSIFNAVRPSEKNNYVNISRKHGNSNFEKAAQEMEQYKLEAQMRNHNKTHKESKWLLKSKDEFGGTQDDILFPHMFAEVKSNKLGPHVIRVRSKVQRNRKRFEQMYSDEALLGRAEEEANKRRRRRNKAGDDDDEDSILNLGDNDEVMEEMDFDDMEKLEEELQLNEEDALSEYEDDESEEEDKETATSRRRRRMEVDEMLAADGEVTGTTDDEDEDLDSSNAEFDAESDDELSSVGDYYKDMAEEDEESSGEEGEESEEDPTAIQEEGSEDPGEDNDEEGFTEQMTEALGEDGKEDKVTRQKHKRLRTD